MTVSKTTHCQISRFRQDLHVWTFPKTFPGLPNNILEPTVFPHICNPAMSINNTSKIHKLHHEKKGIPLIQYKPFFQLCLKSLRLVVLSRSLMKCINFANFLCFSQMCRSKLFLSPLNTDNHCICSWNLSSRQQCYWKCSFPCGVLNSFYIQCKAILRKGLPSWATLCMHKAKFLTALSAKRRRYTKQKKPI